MTTDFRALCAELVDDLELCDWPYKLKEAIRADINRARAALLTEEPALADSGGPAADTDQILRLAAIIHEVDGSHTKGAAALAESILTHPGFRAALADEPAVPEGREPVAVTGQPSDEELFNKTYRLGTAGHQPAPSAEGEVAELALKELERTVVLLMAVTGHKKIKRFDTIRAALKRLQELENNADLSPAPAPAEGEVGDAKHVRRMCEIILGNTFGNEELDSLALLVGHHSDVLNASMVPVPASVPVGMVPVEYWDIDSGARIVTEPSEEGPGGCWVVLNSRRVNRFTEFPTAKAAWDALQQANALPLPQGEVE